MKLKFIFLLFAGLMLMASCSSSDDGPINTDQNNNNNQDPLPELVSIPDEAFEQALIDLGLDLELNGTIPKSSIENVTDLVLNEKGISSLSGIEEFDSLINLWANDNSLTELNVNGLSNLKFIFVERNQLSSLNVVGLTVLEKVALDGNNLTQFNINSSINLQILTISGNQLEGLRVANNLDLDILSVVDNPLTCIEVNATQLNNIPSGWEKDDDDQYSLNCN
jgi:hypothetical protein